MIQPGQIEFCIDRISERLEYGATDRIACPIRLSFDYGLYQVFLTFAAGATLILRDTNNPFGWLRETIQNAQPTVIALTPTMARAALSKWTPSVQSAKVRLITFTGEAVDRHLLATLEEAFPRAGIVLMYGITECKRVTISLPNEWKRDLTAVGSPLRGTAVVIRDQQGRVLPFGEIGEIHVQGPNLTLGYWQDPKLTELKFPVHAGEREFATEDLGYVDATGRLHVVGRLGETYKERGQRVSALEVETAAMRCSGVSAAICLPPNESCGSMLVVRAGDWTTRSEFVQELAEYLGKERLPRQLFRVHDLPLTPNGKMDKRELRTLVDTKAGVAPW